MAQFGLLINCQQSGNGSYTNQSSSWRNNREPIRVCITANNIFLTLETGSSCLGVHRELEFKAHCVSSGIYSRGLSAQRKEERKETRIRPPLSTLWCIHLIPKRLRVQSSIWQYSLALFQAVINTDAHTHTHTRLVWLLLALRYFSEHKHIYLREGALPPPVWQSMELNEKLPSGQQVSL